MLTSQTPHSCKIINPHLALLTARGATGSGEFGVIVTLAPQAKLPPYMKAAGKSAAPGRINARIPCDSIDRIAADRDVLSVELREHVSQ